MEFPTTMWSRLDAAKAGGRTAVGEVLTRYRPAIINFLSMKGFSQADAEDVAQEVMLRLIEHKLLAEADRRKGRFRSLVLAVTRNVMKEHVRKAARHEGRSLDAPVGDSEEEGTGIMIEVVHEDIRDDEFDRCWLLNLVNAALEELRTSGDPRLAEILDLSVSKGMTYEQIGERLNLKVTDITNALHRTRKLLGQRIRKLIADYSSSRDEYETEIRHLKNYLPA
jgi:RNA polymerase sigma factor (sigma-70 family)